jgi:integrase
MGRMLNRLSSTKLRSLRDGLHPDGGGLYLSVADSGRNRSWLFRYAVPSLTASGRQRERWMGLGPIETVSLAEAREAALRCRKLRQEGVDPIQQRREAKAALAVAAAKTLTFDQCAAAYLVAHRPKWRSVRHSQQWENTLRDYATPIIGRLPVAAVDTALVMKVLEQDVGGKPLWQAKPETASRLRGRIEAILSWATVRGYRQGDNPARWTGYLAKLLPSRRELASVVHHPAMPYQEIGAFMALVRAAPGVVARAFEFLVLTAARKKEVLGARWEEIDLAERVWSRPADRMKGGVAHRVPLSGRALAIVREMWSLRQNEFVFPGQRGVMSSNNFARFLDEALGRADVTVHGFRSTFRDWAGEHTAFPREICEAALAHKVGDTTEAAYRRGDALEKRRKLMEAWAEYCTKAPAAGTVTALRSAR